MFLPHTSAYGMMDFGFAAKHPLHNCKRAAHSTEDTFEAESNTCFLGKPTIPSSRCSRFPSTSYFLVCLLLSRCFLLGLHKDTQWLSPWRTKWFEPADLTWVHTSSIRNVAHNNDYNDLRQYQKQHPMPTNFSITSTDILHITIGHENQTNLWSILMCLKGSMRCQS